MAGGEAEFVQVSQIFAALVFLYALHSLNNPESPKRGNIMGGIGMVTAIAFTTWNSGFSGIGYAISIGATAAGLIVGIIAALKVKMTGMPQLVGLLNAFGGLAAVLEGIALYMYDDPTSVLMNTAEIHTQRVEIVLGILIGVLTFFGSIVASCKLNGWLPGKPLMYSGRIQSYFFLLFISLVFGAIMVPSTWEVNILYAVGLCVFAAILGIVWVMGIGGADMPVVVSILNSLSGWSGCAAGFMMGHPLLIISGAMVGAAGFILSDIMCVSMNRPLLGVLKGGFGDGATTHKPKEAEEEQTYATFTVDDTARALKEANKIYIIPGYGMAVAQCQQTVAAIGECLRAAGKTIRYAVHPVAGRMPGHMNVLLAEAKVPYTDLIQYEAANADFASTDVVIVLGANDIVNPSALTDPDSPIAGMQVLECWNAKQVITNKRSMGTGYSGVQNPLFFLANNAMLLGDAKKVMDQLLEKVRATIKPVAKAVSAAAGAAVETELKVVEKVEYPAPTKWVGVPKEMEKDEARVAVTPESVSKLRTRGYGVYIETGAGIGANFTDNQFTEAGAEVVSKTDVWSKAEIIVKIRAPLISGEDSELIYLNENKTLLCLVYPGLNPEVHKALTATKATILAMDMVPRISRAQALDVLSSQAKVAGYRAVLEAAHQFPKFYSAESTAAGDNPPAKFLIIGAGVAGLAAIGTANKFGSVVRAFDTRPIVREEVESLGAEFLEVSLQEDGSGGGGYAKLMSPEFIKAEMALFLKQCKEVDIVITTALIPGRKAPTLITKEHVEAMKPGSVVIDLAAEAGGNCELTKNNEVVLHNGVRVVGYGVARLVNTMPDQASAMYGQNIVAAMKEFGKDASVYKLNLDNEVLRGMMIAHEGQDTVKPYTAPITKQKKLAVSAEQAAASKARDEERAAKKAASAGTVRMIGIAVFVALLLLVAIFCPESFIVQLMTLALACVAGPCVVVSVMPLYDTPLMSLSNAISGIVILGGIDMLGSIGEVEESNMWSTVEGWLNIAAIVIGAINAAGGFVVTNRMLDMFRA